MALNNDAWTFTGNVVGKVAPSQLKTQQVRYITINNGEHLKSTLYYVEKGWIIIFKLGPSLFGKEISLFTNHPESAEKGFNRNEYHQLEWRQEFIPGSENQENAFKDDSKFFAELPIRQAGPYSYYFVEKIGESIETLGSGHFNVFPVLSVGYNEEKVLLLDSIQCHTVLPKCLGPFEEWEKRLRVSKESGYNVIHFTPVQELGASNSSYSIKDQLKVNPKFGNENTSPTFDDLFNLMKKLREEWEVLSISDIVLNHTAVESPWLTEHTECTYNMVTAPYLIPAAVLDGYLYAFGNKVAEGAFLEKGIPSEISTENDLQAIKLYLETEYIPNLHLEEYYICDIDKLSRIFKKLMEKVEPKCEEGNVDDLKLINNLSHGRKQATVDMDLALKIFNKRSPYSDDEDARIYDCVGNFENLLRERNASVEKRINDHLRAAINNCIATIRYERVQSDGPNIRKISAKNPLIPRYFTGKFSDYESVEEEVLQRGQFVMAHNGWLMNVDSPKNFADSNSDVYIRRELVVWGDVVKLRYGESPADCPFIWDHMRKYVEKAAEIFDGVRLDNCHSTPLPVAEYLLDCARKIRPDLYVVAELFTNSEELDNVFINRLGITSLIREAMSAWNSNELGRLIYRYGGDPVGSFYYSGLCPLTPSVAHALFFDVTHDNESPIEKRSVFNCLPNTALVNMAQCGSGSTRGVDELVPHHINVVNEERLYKSWTDNEIPLPSEVNSGCGIISVKRIINRLHRVLNDEGYSQIYVDEIVDNIIAITRHNPSTHNSVVLIAYTAYSYPADDKENLSQPKILKLEGEITDILFETSLYYTGEGGRFSKPKCFTRQGDYINGLLEYKVKLETDITPEESSILRSTASEDSKFSQYELKNFLPGSIIAVKLSPKSEVKPKVELILNLANSLVQKKCLSIIDVTSKLSLGDLNFALYHCSEEGLEEGCGSYHVPGYGSLVYCGLQGISSLLSDIKYNNDLGHPLCQHLRHGDWMLDYVSRRLKAEESTQRLGLWFQEAFETLQHLPRFLIPRYFDVIITSVTDLLLLTAVFQMSEFVRNGSSFVKALALGSVQCIGAVKSAPLPPFSPSLQLQYSKAKALTLCAGLPHFSTGYKRCWGRDTFISLRGLMLLTGRYELARLHILGYAACLRHGLIPNLLDRGSNARYNSRDAVWWWLYSIISYVKLAPNGFKILNDPVSRIFPKDDSLPVAAGIADQPLHCVMQEALTVHFQGLNFRERNAGPELDAHMTDVGFNNMIGVDPVTGFVYGGSEYNCGTWMDKMGSSSTAGNRGQPATPRNGSAVELVGLCKCVLKELSDFHRKGFYPFDSVQRMSEKGDIIIWKFEEWEEKIAQHFDKYFWVEITPNSEETESHLVHRRGIYKDSYGASPPWADYQFRCNFLIALTVAPDITDPSKAWMAIKKAEEILLGPLGIKTLDPADWNYNGNYYNDDNSNNPKVAHGFNYHQGPEWLWPVGYFLRAKLHFACLRGSKELKQSITEIKSYLGGFYKSIMASHWKGLPELTNTNGSDCPGSCRVQAWSMACILEVLYDLHKLEIPEM